LQNNGTGLWKSFFPGFLKNGAKMTLFSEQNVFCDFVILWQK